MDFDINKIKELTLAFAPKVIMAFVLLVLGFWVIGMIRRVLQKALTRNSIDATLSNFITSLVVIGLKVMLLLSVASQFGVDTTSFVAIIGALMVGVGMAMNGSISHFASGVLIMVFKPFKIDDLVEIGGGFMGTVEGINAFNTTLKTLDNKRIIVANSNVTGNTITNISGQGVVGVELTFGIGYNDSIDEARKTILEVGSKCPYILNDPAQGVVVSSLGDSSVNLSTRPFCKSEHYWDTLFYMNEEVKKAFDQNNISIPYPQMDVSISK